MAACSRRFIVDCNFSVHDGRVWNERLPEASQVVEVVAGGTRRVEVPVAMAVP